MYVELMPHKMNFKDKFFNIIKTRNTKSILFLTYQYISNNKKLISFYKEILKDVEVIPIKKQKEKLNKGINYKNKISRKRKVL